MKITKEQLTFLIEQIIREESAVTKQAKQMGLISAGFGQWKNKAGKVTHGSQDGKLVTVGSPPARERNYPPEFEKQSKSSEAQKENMKITRKQLNLLIEQVVREESTTAQQAKQMGLTSAGFGR